MRRIIKAHEVMSPPEAWRPPARAGEGFPTLASASARAPGEEARAPSPREADIEGEARERGLAEGMRVAEEAYRAKLARLDALVAELQAEREEFFTRMEPEVVRLAVAIAEKVVQQELETRPELVVDLVRRMMKRLRERESLRISVNPRDVERVREAKADLLQAVDGVRKLEVVEDRRVDPGGCVIDSPNGTLDARIRTQFEEIEKALELAAPAVAGLPEEENGGGPGALPGDDQ